MVSEGKHTAEFIVSEANGSRSRDKGTLLANQVVVAGELLGIETASGKYVAYDPAGTIVGSDTVAGIAYDNYDATGADKSIVVISRDTEVRGSDLTYNEAVAGTVTAEIAGLKALGLIVR
jgi:hypothetical protein